MTILIDNGHGVETPGKRSPDNRLIECVYTREIAHRMVLELEKVGCKVIRIVPEETDVPLVERVARANQIYAENGKQSLLVSVHCNAMGNGKEWMKANGWSVFVGKNASQKSIKLAEEIAKAALNKKVKVRQPSNTTLYWTSNLYICQRSNCPAVLVENFFQDNREDVDFLLSEEGKQCVTDIMVEGILNYLRSL